MFRKRQRKRFVLTLDGGGVRGIVPASVLMEVEARANKPIYELFDMICGTSSGAILAAGVCLKDESGRPKFTPQDILQVYEEQGPKIFEKSFFRTWTHWIYGSQYSETALENVLESHFGNSQLQDTLTNLMIPAYNITADTPKCFKSWVTQDKSLLLKDLIRAATAAPTFFKPKKMKIPRSDSADLEDALLYDGGVFAKNISVCAYAEALEMFPDDEIHVFSIGTGDNRVFSEAENPGTLPFVNTLVDMVFSSSENVVNYQMRRVIKDRYTRIQLTKDSKAFFGLDDTSSEAIQGLKNDARTVIQEHSARIDRFLDIRLNR